jgi:lipoprotein-anchoring transpeptidase ErfK/SrfK
MRTVAGLLALGAIVSGCGGRSEDNNSGERPPGQVELAFSTGEQFRKVERKLPVSRQEPLPAVNALLDGPTQRERAHKVQTVIPDGVSVEKLSVSGSGGAAIELSPEFLNGIPADPAQRNREQKATLNARLGQVIYTLTQFPEVRSAKVAVGGVVLDADLTRADYAPPETGPKRVSHAAGAPVPGIRKAQKRLAALSYLPKEAVDGLDGYRTQQAVIAFQAWNGLARDGVIGPATRARLKKAGRPKPGGRGPSRRIEVYRDKGVTLLISGGRTVRAVHVSSGGPGTPTPAGSFKIFRKELKSWSVPFKTWLPYASYFFQGIAFHEYPDVPPFPASHGCVRVPVPEAKGVYEFAQLGTTVIVR